MKRLATQYVSHLLELAPESRRVVDKMPINYALLGLIHLALPKAKIIHVSRHPVDTCLSIYTTPNRSRIEWAHQKDDIVFAYREYERLMSHWQDKLPKNVIHHVRYKDLILDREKKTRSMVEFCGLEWEDAFLFPEQNERAVFTPSVWQVRQPVYRTSLERWRNYEPWLGEFSQLLQHRTD